MQCKQPGLDTHNVEWGLGSDQDVVNRREESGHPKGATMQ